LTCTAKYKKCSKYFLQIFFSLDTTEACKGLTAPMRNDPEGSSSTHFKKLARAVRRQCRQSISRQQGATVSAPSTAAKTPSSSFQGQGLSFRRRCCKELMNDLAATVDLSKQEMLNISEQRHHIIHSSPRADS